MEKNEFRKLVEQVAEIKDCKPSKSPNHRPAIEYITEVDEDGEEYQVPVEIKDNPTLGFKLIKVKDQHKSCELGCGKIVTNQVIEKRLVSTPTKHWRTRCRNCDMYVNPNADGFIRGSHKVQHEFIKHFKHTHNTFPEVVSESRTIETAEYTETVTNDNIIRKYK